MEKSSDALRTISEVSEMLDTPKHVLRFWESKFPQLQPMKRGGGRRYYRPEDILLLKAIRNLLYVEGFTIRGVQQIFRRDGIDHVKSFAMEAAAPKEGQGKSPSKAGGKSGGKKAAASKARSKPKSAAKGQPAADQNALLNALLKEIDNCRALLAHNHGS